MMKSRNSILILLALISIVKSDENEFSVEDIKELKEALDNSSIYMENQPKNEDAIIFVGTTRSGKSTLINYLIGNEMVAEKLYKGSPFTIRNAYRRAEGPEIGSGTTSKTTIPSRWTSRKLPNLVIWDSPGFDDNRGPVQDITNAFYLYQLLQRVKSLRVVLAVDINDLINDNIKPFVSALTAVEDLLGYKNETHSSILTVIFTKVPDTLNDEPVDMELVSNMLSEKVLRSGMQLSNTAKDIVEFLINNHNRMAFFKRAKLGKITDDIAVNIFPAITSSSQLEEKTLTELRPSIAEKSKVRLLKSRSVLLPKKVFRDLEMVLSSVIDKKVQDLDKSSVTEEAENKIRTQITQLNEIEGRMLNALAQKSDFYTKLEIIQPIDPDIKKHIEEHNLREKIGLMKFVDNVLDLEESYQTALSMEAVLLNSDTKVRESITSAKLRLGYITQQKHNELLEKYRKKHLDDMESLYRKFEETEKRNKEAEALLYKNLIALISPLILDVAGKRQDPNFSVNMLTPKP